MKIIKEEVVEVFGQKMIVQLVEIEVNNCGGWERKVTYKSLRFKNKFDCNKDE